MSQTAVTTNTAQTVTVDSPAPTLMPHQEQAQKAFAQQEQPQDDTKEAPPVPPVSPEGDTPKAPAPTTEPPKDPTLDDALAAREEVNGFLAQHNIELSSLEDTYDSEGSLSEEQYAALEKAGITRKMTDNYIAGVVANRATLTVMQENEIKTVKASVGGDGEYAKMTTWAVSNLPQDEIDGFNAILATNNMGAVKVAVNHLANRYKAAMGSPAKYKVEGNTSTAPQGSRFESWAEVQAAMSDPRYNNDPAYNRKVVQKIANSNF